jgi:hypothetical protein
LIATDDKEAVQSFDGRVAPPFVWTLLCFGLQLKLSWFILESQVTELLQILPVEMALHLFL